MCFFGSMKTPAMPPPPPLPSKSNEELLAEQQRSQRIALQQRGRGGTNLTTRIGAMGVETGKLSTGDQLQVTATRLLGG